MAEFSTKFMQKIAKFLPKSPLMYVILVVLLLTTGVYPIVAIFSQNLGSLKFYFGLLVYLVISVLTRAPDRFRPALSFKVGMGLATILAITNGLWYGILFAVVTVLIEAKVVVEYPQQIPQTLLYRVVFNCVLPVLFAVPIDNMVFFIVFYIALMYIVSTPIRVMSGNFPLWYQIQYSVFNIGWNLWFFWIFGEQLLAMVA